MHVLSSRGCQCGCLSKHQKVATRTLTIRGVLALSTTYHPTPLCIHHRVWDIEGAQSGSCTLLLTVDLVFAAGEEGGGSPGQIRRHDYRLEWSGSNAHPTLHFGPNLPNHTRRLPSSAKMDEFTVDAFVNRDDPIPVISFDQADDLSDEAEVPSTPERKGDKLLQHGKNLKENLRNAHGKVSETGSSMQDRLLEKYV